MQCPKESTADSRYPNCKTESIVNATYDPLFNEFNVCHPGSYGTFPKCICENGNGMNQIENSIFIRIKQTTLKNRELNCFFFAVQIRS